MDIDELIKHLTELRKEVGNVKVTISIEDGNKVRELSEIFTDTDIDCNPSIVLN